MRVNYVVTIFGSDRPGIVEGLSNAIAKLGGNWQESQMTRLAGRFAGIICIGVPEGTGLGTCS